MRVLIVEDETAAADHLTFLLRKADPTIEIAGYAESVEQTATMLASHPHIDLIFMDIHLSDGSAFSIFQRIEVDTPIVFTTAFDQYALEAFKVNSIDYLLKPIKQQDLMRAIEKFRRLAPPELNSYISALPQLSAPRQYPSRILIPLKDKLIPIPVEEICYIFSTNRQTEIALTNHRTFTIHKSLDQLQATLNPARFRRANKQFIIAKDSVREVVAWFDNRLAIKLLLPTPEEIFVSKNNASEFKRWLTD